MTTPTPSQTSNPSSASKKAAGHVSTPSHLNYTSPLSRSVPSPAATRKEYAGKTPINHPTTGSTGSKATPMMHSLSQQGNTQGTSPGTNLLGSFGTPVGLGVGLESGVFTATPSGGMGGAAMLPTMSDLGLKRNEDEERRKKMRRVLKSIGRTKGRVSEEGIARISRRVGFQNDIDAEKLSEAEKARKVGNREIVIAGKKIIISVDLAQHVPQKVQVEFATENQALMQVHAPAAAKVLLEDLRAEDGVPLHATLDRFAMNLERLAALDRLSANINCFEAVHGVYANLVRLWEAERKDATELEVMCHKSGRPKLHADGRLRFSVEYWKHRRHVKAAEKDAQVFKLHIDVEPSPAALYPPLRVSEGWLPDPLELPAQDSGEALPWRDPPQTFETSGADGDALVMGNGQKLPDLRFVARLDPPITIEYTTAVNLLSSLGVPAPQLTVFPPHYHVMVSNPEAPYMTNPQPPPTLTSSRTVLTVREGEDKEVRHANVLYAKSQEFGWRIEELPFSHPRQIIEALPVLRQWASIGCLLNDAFSSQPLEKEGLDSDINGVVNNLDLTDLPTPPATPFDVDSVPIYMDIACLPLPTLSVTYPIAGQEEGSVGITSVQILSNAHISTGKAAGETNTNPNDDPSAMKKIARTLDRCNDLGVWIEWLRSRP